jgi:hypothetical protein
MGKPNQNIVLYLKNLEAKLNSLTSQLAQIRNVKTSQLPNSLPGQYQGKPIPSVEGAEIYLPDGHTPGQRVQATINLASDGPFLARAFHVAYRTTGGWLPIDGAFTPPLIAMFGGMTTGFYWEYYVNGSRRDRQNIAAASPLLDGAEQGHGYFDFLTNDIFEPSSKIDIFLTLLDTVTDPETYYVALSGIYAIFS